MDAATGLHASPDLSELLPQLGECTGTGICCATAAGSILYLNPALRRLLELETAAAPGELRDLLPAEDRPLLERELLPAALARGAGSGELALQTARGNTLPVWLDMRALRDAGGGLLGLVCTFTDLSRWKQRERDLLDSAAHQRTLVEYIPQRVFFKDVHSRYLAANLHYAADLGIAPEDIVGRDDFDFHPRELAEHYRRADQSVMSHGATEEFDESYVRDGRTYTIHTVKTPVRDAAGQVIGLCGIFWDVSEQRRLEARLRESEATLRAIYDNAQEGIMVASIESGLLTMANPAICRMLGYGEAELLTMAPPQLHPPEVLPRLEEIFARMAAGEFPPVEELPFRRKDGSIVHLDASTTPVVIGGKAGFLGVFRDATEKRLARETLARHSEQLEAQVRERTAALEQQNLRNATILDVAIDGFFVADTNGRLVDVNPAFCRMLGHERAELLERTIADIEAAENPVEVARHVEQVRIQGHDRFETRHRRKDGGTLDVEISVNRVEIAGATQLFAFVRDISERKRSEAMLLASRQEAERANAAKSEFLSSMSHELRTPMNAIIGFAQLLEYDPGLDPNQLDNVHEILKAGRHLLELINEVLDLAKIESGRVELSLEPVELAPVVAECLHLVAPLAERRRIRVAHAAGPDAVARADRTRLKQVILNLLSNAIKYNRDAGSVSLDVFPADRDRLRIEVADSGPGIPPERLAELFQPFNRLGSENSEIEGTGIGLTITRRVVELMGGRVDVASEPGVGSRFWIDLPRAAAPPLRLPAAGNPGAGGTVDAASGAVTVLYIEDNPANLKLVAQMFTLRPRVRLLCAPAPELGIELAMAHRPDLVLLDINLPGMDGYQVLRILRAAPALKHIPVVAVTANAMLRDIERGQAAGFAAYLTKPLMVDQFLRTVDAMLGAPPQRDRQENPP
jgi:PAS domain S-box-containing protein